MKHQAWKIPSAILILLLCISVSIGHAQTPQQTLTQYVSDLQKNPNDYALREKIIRHVQTMRPAPAIPEEARRHYVMALTMFKGAKKIEDYGDSIDEFKSALLIAPWWAEANRDLGMACEAAKRYEEAINALGLYISSGPGEEKVRAARDEIYKIEAMKKLAAREKTESAPQAVSAPKQNTFDDLLGKINGRRYWRQDPVNRAIWTIEVKGRVLRLGVADPDSSHFSERGRFEVQGLESTYPLPGRPGEVATFIINQDGDRITQRIVRRSDGAEGTFTFNWER